MTDTPEERVIEDRETLKKRVRDMAEVRRLARLTPGDGKAMSYREKLDEARLVVADTTAATALTPEQALDLYPVLVSEIGINGATLVEVAQTIIYVYKMWAQLEGRINGTEMQSCKAIDEAASDEAAQDVFDAIDWGSL